jgi:hypothetical protein
MGISAEGLFGGSPTESIRDQNRKKVESFQAGKTKIMYGNADTMGTGTSFDDTKGDSPRTILVMTPPFSAMDFVQVMGRVNRLQTKSKATVKLIGMESPFAQIDDWMNQLLQDKVQYLGEVVKGDISEFNMGGGKTKKILPRESGNHINIDNYRRNPSPIKLDFSEQTTAKKSKNWGWFLDHLHRGIKKQVDGGVLYEKSY